MVHSTQQPVPVHYVERNSNCSELVNGTTKRFCNPINYKSYWNESKHCGSGRQEIFVKINKNVVLSKQMLKGKVSKINKDKYL